MPFKPNYRQQRNDRLRAKEAKKEKRLQRQKERVDLRKGVEETPGAAVDPQPDPPKA